MTSPIIGVQTLIYLKGSSGDVNILKEGTGFVATGGENPDTTGDPYDRSKQPYWRLRVDTTTLTFSTAAERAGPWTSRAVVPNSVGYESVRLYFGAGAWKQLPSPGSATFSCLNKICP